MQDLTQIQRDFATLNRKVNGHPLVYLDNGATSLMPTQVINAITTFETEHRANVHRGVHTLSQEATTQYERARECLSQFLGSGSQYSLQSQQMNHVYPPQKLLKVLKRLLVTSSSFSPR